VSRPIRLSDLTPDAAREALARTPRLLIPVGTLVPRGPHLPLGSDTFLLERLADDLSARTGVPRAPVVAFGVHALTRDGAPGSAGLTRKTLHRTMNELIAAWETGAKVRDTTILTAHPTEAHQEALSTIRTGGTVRMVDIFAMGFDDLVTWRQGPVHGGEIDTSLLLALAPDVVHRDRLPLGLAASADKGLAIYQRMLDRVARLIEAPVP
jgi:creatinine amidohydrolase